MESSYSSMYRSPAAAGKIYQRTDTAKNCLHPPKDGKETCTSQQITKFTNTDAGRPEVGKMRLHWRKMEDKDFHEGIARQTHGLKSTVSDAAKDLLNPKMKSLYLQTKVEDAESIYKSRQVGPLGRTANPIAPVPEKYADTFFGKQTEKGENAGLTVNPPKSAKEVETQAAKGHKLYVKTHHDYYVGEQIRRNYHDTFQPNSVFGIETPHSNDGRDISRTLRWPTPDNGENADRFGSTKFGVRVGSTKLVSDRVDAFRERTQPQLGKVHDPVKSTAGISEAFGLGLLADGCGAGDIIHGRDKAQWLLGKDRQRGVLAAVRQHLKKANYHNFKTLKDAFHYYDKSNTGFISIDDLRAVSFQFNLPIHDHTLASLMAISSDGTGKINYVRFVNLLNWKDKMPIDQEIEECKDEIVQQIDKSVNENKTSSSIIKATVGGLDTDKWHTYGVPTVRSDIPAPSIRRVSDHTNYGDELDAHSLLNPSIFSSYGVYESDFFEPRNKSTIRRIFKVIGVDMDDESFENSWKKACEYQKEFYNKNNVDVTQVSVECFRLVLDEIQSLAK